MTTTLSRHEFTHLSVKRPRRGVLVRKYSLFVSAGCAESCSRWIVYKNRVSTRRHLWIGHKFTHLSVQRRRNGLLVRELVLFVSIDRAEKLQPLECLRKIE